MQFISEITVLPPDADNALLAFHTTDFKSCMDEL